MALFGSNKKEKKENAVISVKEKNPVVAESNFNILKRPVISEKALGLESRGEYVFMVAGGATKPEVKKEVEKKYGVKVERVNMIVYKPEQVLFKGRAGTKSGFKKAMVKLATGQKIEILPK